MTKSRRLALLSVLLAATSFTAGCRNHYDNDSTQPPRLPGQLSTKNPDFVDQTTWVNESATHPFREVTLSNKGFVSVTIDDSRARIDEKVGYLPNGKYKLWLYKPASKQSLLAGYPRIIDREQAIWFVDNANNPSIAQLVMLVPSGMIPQPLGYYALLGTYVRGTDVIEWDVFEPSEQSGIVSLVPSKKTTLNTALVFRKK